MPTDVGTVTTRDRIPLWLAVAITVVVSLPFGIWLSRWNLPIWVSFIVWAEYFALGAKAAALIKIVPAYLSGVAVASAIMTFYVWLTKEFGTTYWVKPTDLALIVAAFVGFCIFIFAMKYIPFWRDNTLPFFNGVSMGLAVYFTGAFVHPFPAVVSVYALPWIAAAGRGNRRPARCLPWLVQRLDHVHAQGDAGRVADRDRADRRGAGHARGAARQ